MLCDSKNFYVNKIYKDTLFFSKAFLSFLSYNDDLSSNFICMNDFIFYSDAEYNFLRNMNYKFVAPYKYIDFITTWII